MTHSDENRASAARDEIERLRKALRQISWFPKDSRNADLTLSEAIDGMADIANQALLATSYVPNA